MICQTISILLTKELMRVQWYRMLPISLVQLLSHCKNKRQQQAVCQSLPLATNLTTSQRKEKANINAKTAADIQIQMWKGHQRYNPQHQGWTLSITDMYSKEGHLIPFHHLAFSIEAFVVVNLCKWMPLTHVRREETLSCDRWVCWRTKMEP